MQLRVISVNLRICLSVYFYKSMSSAYLIFFVNFVHFSAYLENIEKLMLQN